MRSRETATIAAATVVFLLLTAWFTYPQIIALDQVIAHQDPMFSTWRLAWVAHQLPRAPLQLLDTNILFPDRGTAVYSDAAPLLGAMAAPLIWAGVPAVIAYNVMMLASFVCAALGAFLLVRELTGSLAAGLFAGLAFGFSPFRFEHYMHLEIVWSCWIPFTLWALHRTIATGRWGYGIATGLFIAAQFFSCVYLAVFLVTWLVVIGLLLIAFRVLDLRGRALRALVVGAIVGAAVVAPYGRAYLDSSRVVGTRSNQETLDYSAIPSNYLASPSGNLMWGWTAARWGDNEKDLFPGAAVMVLALVGLLWPPIGRMRVIYALAALFAFDLSMGLYGYTYGALRNAIPFFQGLRVTARAATLVQLGLAVLGGYGIARLMAMRTSTSTSASASPSPSTAPASALTSGSSGASVSSASPGVMHAKSRGVSRVGAAIALAAGVVTIVEFTNVPISLAPLPTRPSLLQKWLSQQKDMVIFELPAPRANLLPGEDPRYQFLSTFHWQPMINGYSAFAPPRYIRLLEMMVNFPDARSIGAIRARGATHLVIHPELFQPPLPAVSGRALVERLAASPDFAFMGWFPDGIGTAAVFQLVNRPR